MRKIDRIVVKIGTKVITSHDRALDKQMLMGIAGQVSDVRDKGRDIIIVTSGAIGAGLWLLGKKKRPGKLSELQASAAVGQSYLMKLYSEFFRDRGYLTAQVLLTQDDFNNRRRYLNIKHTLETLLRYKIIPIINENDTVATDEIKCGDNDRLSGLVADLVRAEKLILLTDVDGLLDDSGEVIKSVTVVDNKITKLAGGSHCDLGTGGMATKLASARRVAESGIDCVIANGRARNIITRLILDKENLGTIIYSSRNKFDARKRWIAYSSSLKGAVIIDGGAFRALSEKHKSLLPSGIIAFTGDFRAGDVVSVNLNNGHEFARGVVNYSSGDIGKIKGLKSSEIKNILGPEAKEEAIHKDNLVIVDSDI